MLPDLPTIASSGVPDFEAVQWYGIVAPARTPPEVIALLNAEVNRALASPELKARLDAEGAEPTPSTPDAFGRLISEEIARWRPVIEQARGCVPNERRPPARARRRRPRGCASR